MNEETKTNEEVNVASIPVAGDLAVKRNAWRPRKYETPEELESIILEYFETCAREKRPLTITGLANALDITRKSLLNYEGREEFLPTIKKAKTIVEQYAEEQLYQGKNVAGVIFNLKNNYGWVDKKEIQGTSFNLFKVLKDIDQEDGKLVEGQIIENPQALLDKGQTEPEG